MILCPHETIISKSEADFDTQRRRRAPRDLEGSVATLLRLPNRFAPLAKVCVVTHFIIVGGFWIGLLHTVVPLSKRLPLEAKGRTKTTGAGDFFRSICPLPWSDGSQSARAGLFPAWPRSMDVQNGNSPFYARAAHCH